MMGHGLCLNKEENDVVSNKWSFCVCEVCKDMETVFK